MVNLPLLSKPGFELFTENREGIRDIGGHMGYIEILFLLFTIFVCGSI